MSYTTISIEGGLFPPDLLERISLGDGGIKGQAPGDFGLPPSRRLLDEMQRSFSDARKYWDAFGRRLERSRESRTTPTREVWMAELFELLGFLPLEYQRAAVEAGGASFPISYRTHSAENAPPIHIVAVDQPLDERGPARRTPHALVQDFLNRSEALWGVVTNGAKLRLLQDSARLSKPTYLEFDIQAMIEGNAYDEFVVLYRLLHATRFPSNGVEPHECLLEGYYTQGTEEGGRVREKLRDGVKSALEVLGTALVEHPRNDVLRDTLRSGRLDEVGYYRQFLNFVYRMLFLMVTEERKLLSTRTDHERQTICDCYYSITRLRDRAERYFAGDGHGDLWEGLAQTFCLFRDETAAQRLGLSPLNGELFRSSACRDIESVFCPNKSFLAAIRHLSTFDDNGVRRRVNYAHLDVEEFGSVYESLLDYRPVVQLGDASFVPHRFELAAGTERKQTGSYYTPPELVRELIDSALVPVIEDRLTTANTPESKEGALLALRVCDPASGSGHFLLAAARRIAHELAKVRTGEEEPGLVQYRTAIGDVVRNCIYAVDKNPLAGIAVVVATLLGQSVGLADGGVQIDGQRRVAGSGPGSPGPCQQLPAHPLQLADVAPPEAAKEGSQGGWRLDSAAQGANCPAGTQRVGVVNAVAPSQRRRNQAHHLVARVRPPRRISEVNVAVDELMQTQVLGEGHRKEQPCIGHQTVIPRDMQSFAVRTRCPPTSAC